MSKGNDGLRVVLVVILALLVLAGLSVLFAILGWWEVILR
jgi:hypothetical protein